MSPGTAVFSVSSEARTLCRQVLLFFSVSSEARTLCRQVLLFFRFLQKHEHCVARYCCFDTDELVSESTEL